MALQLALPAIGVLIFLLIKWALKALLFGVVAYTGLSYLQAWVFNAYDNLLVTYVSDANSYAEGSYWLVTKLVVQGLESIGFFDAFKLYVSFQVASWSIMGLQVVTSVFKSASKLKQFFSSSS